MSKNNYWLVAAFINTLTALLHLIGGQLELIRPLLDSNLPWQAKTELLGVWHMVTVFLFATSIVYWRAGTQPQNKLEVVAFISYLYLLFGGIFVACSIYAALLAPQFILLIPIGLLGLVGKQKENKK